MCFVPARGCVRLSLPVERRVSHRFVKWGNIMPVHRAPIKLAFPGVLFLAMAHYMAAQGSAAQHPLPGTVPTPAAVLKESYDDSAGMFPEERAFLLGFLAEAATGIDSGQAASWAKEGLGLAARLPHDWNTVALEKNLLTAMAASDASEAMRGLCFVDPPPVLEDGSFPEEDPRAYSTRRIFPAYWRQAGYKGLDEIKRVSQCLAANGQFPFAGVSPVVTSLGKDHPDDALSLYFLAANYIAARPDIEAASGEIVDFLLTRRGQIADALLTPGFRAAVKRLEAQIASGHANSAVKSVLSVGKAKLAFANEAEMLLARLLPSLGALDPGLAKKVAEDHPNLAAAAASRTGESHVEAAVVQGQTDPATMQALQAQGLETARLTEVQRLAATDPGAAVALANTIATPAVHAQAIAIATEAMSSSDPAPAGKLLDSSLGDLAAIHDVPRRIEASLPALRALRARGDTAAVEHLYEQLLSAGLEAWKADTEAHPVRAVFMSDVYWPLRSLARLGAALDPVWTLAELRKIGLPARSYLLIPAAQGLADPAPRGTTSGAHPGAIRPE